MRRAKRSWAVRVGALELVFVVGYGASFLLLPSTANGVAVTVRQYTYGQDWTGAHGAGTTIFQRTFTDGATVSALRTTLDGMHYAGLFSYVVCQPGVPGSQSPTNVYSIDLVWHGMSVKSYVTVVFGGVCYWDVTTLGVGNPQVVTDGPRTWQDLLHLTGMPDVSLCSCAELEVGGWW